MIALWRQRRLGVSLAGLIVAASFPAGLPAQDVVPLLTRIKMATIGAPNLDDITAIYPTLIGYAVVEEGIVARDLAESWGAPGSAGRPYIVMQPESGDEVFVRAVEIDRVEGFKGLTTWGWTSIEFVVDDPDALHERIKTSALEVLGVPKQLEAFPSIRAMQIRGPAEEILHMTAEMGDRSASLLPLPGAEVGGLIIIILAVPDVAPINDWYSSTFGMRKNEIRQQTIETITRAQRRPSAHQSDATFLAMAEPGNFLELWSLDPSQTTERPRHDGQLPPDVAMATYAVRSLEAVDTPYLTAPKARDGRVYAGNRSAVFVGQVGELVELIEERD